MTAASSAEPPSPDRALTDTNVLVYCFTPDDVAKQRVAVALVDDLLRRRSLVVSTQVLNEFYVAITRPTRAHPLSHEDAVSAIHRLAATADVQAVDQAVTFRALMGVKRHGLSFWDAVIWAAARESGVTTIYTEDFQHGRDVEGVVFVNPFIQP